MIQIGKDDLLAAFKGLEKIARLDNNPNALDFHVELANTEVYQDLREDGIDIDDTTVIEANDQKILHDAIVAFAIFRFLLDSEITGMNDAIKDKMKFWRDRYFAKYNLFVNAFKDMPEVHSKKIEFGG